MNAPVSALRAGTTEAGMLARLPLVEWAAEGLGLGLFMISACAFTVLLEHPASPGRAAIANGDVRRALIGVAMGLTAIALVYSPWGRRSGAHLNPSVTLAFLRLGRVRPRDAAGYVTAQFLGGTLGVFASAAMFGARLADPHVRYAITVPGPPGPGVAFAAELAMAFGLMSLVLRAAANPRWQHLTGVFAGCTVFLYIALLAPLSGMSMNPARTFASAAAAHVWTSWWLYFVAPVVGMQAAVAVHRRLHRDPDAGCAKLRHTGGVRCIFCEYRAAQRRDAPRLAP